MACISTGSRLNDNDQRRNRCSIATTAVYCRQRGAYVTLNLAQGLTRRTLPPYGPVCTRIAPWPLRRRRPFLTGDGGLSKAPHDKNSLLITARPAALVRFGPKRFATPTTSLHGQKPPAPRKSLDDRTPVPWRQLRRWPRWTSPMPMRWRP